MRRWTSVVLLAACSGGRTDAPEASSTPGLEARANPAGGPVVELPAEPMGWPALEERYGSCGLARTMLDAPDRPQVPDGVESCAKPGGKGTVVYTKLVDRDEDDKPLMRVLATVADAQEVHSECVRSGTSLKDTMVVLAADPVPGTDWVVPTRAQDLNPQTGLPEDLPAAALVGVQCCTNFLDGC